ncbi:hypothetical protein [Bacillus licheniformis]|uniref:hypothetical protein n=1 Tax=Bacillus licheniformis TaxID=1402 RepID=UPI002E23BDF7|nr:hypothetical protein [Bacillus licheniformis]
MMKKELKLAIELDELLWETRKELRNERSKISVYDILNDIPTSKEQEEKLEKLELQKEQLKRIEHTVRALIFQIAKLQAMQD